MSRGSPPSRPRRRYRLRARADQRDATHRRIARAAVELHGRIGPTRTTISAVADRAGVERLTVYRHFPDERALFAACSREFLEENPPPDVGPLMMLPDPEERLTGVLRALYRYYRQTSSMMTALIRDAETTPLVAEYLAPYHATVAMLADQLSIGFRSHRRRELRAAIGHALDFTTWRSLTERQRLTDAQATRVMTAFVGSVATLRRSGRVRAPLSRSGAGSRGPLPPSPE